MAARTLSQRALAWMHGEEVVRWLDTEGQKNREAVTRCREIIEIFLERIESEIQTLELLPCDTGALRRLLIDNEVSPQNIDAVLAVADRLGTLSTIAGIQDKIMGQLERISKIHALVQAAGATVLRTAMETAAPIHGDSLIERNVTPTRRKLGLSGALAERETVQDVEAEAVETE